MWPNPQLPADLVTFTEEIFNGKLYFLCSALCLTALAYEFKETPITYFDLLSCFRFLQSRLLESYLKSFLAGLKTFRFVNSRRMYS